eukprot:404614-Rhodomonas_salina.1
MREGREGGVEGEEGRQRRLREMMCVNEGESVAVAARRPPPPPGLQLRTNRLLPADAGGCLRVWWRQVRGAGRREHVRRNRALHFNGWEPARDSGLWARPLELLRLPPGLGCATASAPGSYHRSESATGPALARLSGWPGPRHCAPTTATFNLKLKAARGLPVPRCDASGPGPTPPAELELELEDTATPGRGRAPVGLREHRTQAQAAIGPRASGRPSRPGPKLQVASDSESAAEEVLSGQPPILVSSSSPNKHSLRHGQQSRSPSQPEQLRL